jgi:3-oxoacyl-[acyl-carrier protein] reductase
MSSSLDGKVALITGGSRGIGRAIALRFAREGAMVSLSYAKSAEHGVAAVEAIRSLGGVALAVQADVTEVADVRRMFRETLDHFGKLDILVNNAGVADFRPLDQVDEAHYARVFDTNVRGLLFATQEAARAFGTGGGVVVNVSSLAGQNNHPGNCVYSASKAAVDALTRTLAMELGPRRIRVNAVAPGMTRTEMMTSVVPLERQQQVAQATAMRRLGEVEDIADVVAFLASDAARFIVGQVVLVDGGRPR